jgi:outer membrane protein assembly factor BamB
VRGLVLAALALWGCAGTTPSSAFPRAGESADVAAALARMTPSQGVANGSGQPRVFLTVNRTSGPEIVAADLATGAVLWRQSDELGARIAVARSAIAYARPDGTLVGRDVASGALLWEHRLPAGRMRVGHAAGGDAVYDVTTAGNPREIELVCYDARRGSADWRQDLEGEAGAPAVRDGVVALPRRSQYVTLIDGASGRVLADILSREEAATFVRARPEGLFFGSRGVFLASAENATASRKGGGYVQATLPSFIRPQYDRDMYRPGEGDYSAIDRNRLLWRLDVDGPRLRFDQGLVVAHSFRFFFGLEADSGRLRWAYNHPAEDAVASDRIGRHVLFVAADGGLGAVDVGTGRHTWRARIPVGGVVRGATLDAEGWAPPDNVDGREESLAHALASILWDPDKRFQEVKQYAVDELARLKGKEVTVELLRALEATELPPAVVQRATDALVDRRDPASLELYAAALRVRSDYAEDRRAPRLDVLARAVAVTKAVALVPALLEHLRFPETDPAAVRDIADAALATEARESVAPFQDYLLQYRADPGFARAPGPVLAAAEVVLKLGGPSHRATLLWVADDARTIDPLRAHLRRALFPAEAGGAPR